MSWLSESRIWRRLIACAAILVLGIVALIGYWLADGRRKLDRELELLRASGAPEFPEQIVFAPRAAGEDPQAWWDAIDAASQDWSIENLPECSSRLAAGEDEYDIDTDSQVALSDPRRVVSLSACELAVLRLRVEADRPALELALQFERFAVHDWKSASQELRISFKEPFFVPKIPGFIHSIRLLAAHSVLTAVDGDPVQALRCSLMTHKAAGLLGETPSVVSHLARNLCLSIWIHGCVLPLVHLLPADTDWSQIDALLAAIDLQSEFQQSIVGERAVGNGIYRILRERGAVERLPENASSRLARTFLDRDQAMYLELMRGAIERAERSGFDAWRGFDKEIEQRVEESSRLIDGVVWMLLFPQLADAACENLGLQTRIHLVRGALIARREGADAALAWLAQFKDPFNGEALRSRLDPDGILCMWSVGKDGQDNPPVEQREEYQRLDDILVEVRVR